VAPSVGCVKPIAFALQLEGEAVELDGGRYWVETRAASNGAAWSADDEIGTGRAVCRRQLELWDDGSLVETGELDFGAGDSVTFRARGALTASPDPRRRQGTAVFEVTGGRGRLAGARGYVTSNFLLADSGELTDHHLGLLFLERPQGEEAPRSSS
jgi:hypothetical protein